MCASRFPFTMTLLLCASRILFPPAIAGKRARKPPVICEVWSYVKSARSAVPERAVQIAAMIVVRCITQSYSKWLGAIQ